MVCARNLSVVMAGRWWGGYKVVEPEVQWFPNGQTGTPFLAVSGIRQEHGEVERSGFSLWMGVQIPLFLDMKAIGGLGWRSLYGGASDKHWFRLRSGVMLHL